MRWRFVGWFFVVALGVAPLGAGAQVDGEPSLEENDEASTSPADSYGLRYVRRALIMPKGMVRGTFDMTVGNSAGLSSIAFDFGAAISPVDHLEIGFSRYRMGSFPSASALSAPGGAGLIPLIAEGQEFVPLLRTKGGAFGDMVAYARAGSLAGGPVDFAFDLGFLIPTVSEFGMLIGIPLRFHGGNVAAVDTGLEILLNEIGGGGTIATISVPINLVFNVTDEGFLMLNSGVSAFNAGKSEELRSTTFPLGVGVGYTVSAPRTMVDIFAIFSWPVFGTLIHAPAGSFFESSSENVTNVSTITIGANFYSPVLFGK